MSASRSPEAERRVDAAYLPPSAAPETVRTDGGPGAEPTADAPPAEPRPLHRLVERQARLRPDATAVEMEGEALRYAELDREANRLARALRAAGCREGDRVCFLLPKSLDAVVTILAVLKAGATYVPLDPDIPPPRLAKMIRRAEPRAIVARDDTRTLLRGVVRHGDPGGRPALGWLGEGAPPTEGWGAGFDRDDVAAQSAEPLGLDADPARPAYIFFTSGSTGTPKGVVITHANVDHFVRWCVRYFGIGPDDRNSCHAPLHFDLSTFDLYASFAAGATVHLVPPSLNLHPRLLAEWIRDRELTQWFSVPTVLTYMASFGVLREGDFPSLERVLWCGEVLPTATLMQWMERVPHARYTNLYGPTEATVASSYYTVPSAPDDPREEIPIGTPCDGEELMVLDDELRPVAPGEVGGLYIAGVGLSSGYWRDEERTAAAFLPDPRGGGGRIYRTGDLAVRGEDGLFYFRARDDAQVKIRGYRIESGEVENALFSLRGVREAVVVAVETGGFQGTEIACAYVAGGESAADPARIRSSLRELLPSYMLPSRWRVLERLPKNRNGKIDRRRVRRLFEEEVT